MKNESIEQTQEQELLSNWTRIGAKRGGANKSTEKGGIYTLGETKGLVKQNIKHKKLLLNKDIAEYVAGELFNKLTLDPNEKSKGPEVVLVVNSDKIPPEESKDVYLCSKFIPNFEELYVNTKRVASKEKVFADPGSRSGFEEWRAKKLEKIGIERDLTISLNKPYYNKKDFADIVACSLLLDDHSYHSGNLGVIKNIKNENLKEIKEYIDELPQETNFKEETLFKIDVLSKKPDDFNLDNFDLDRFRLEVIDNLEKIANEPPEKKVELEKLISKLQYNLVRIDFGAAFETFSSKVDPYYMRPGSQKPNYFKDYPEDFILTPELVKSLMENSKKDLSNDIEESMNKIGKFYNEPEIRAFAKQIEFNIPENISKEKVIESLKERMKERMKERQLSLKNLATEVEVDLFIKKGGLTNTEELKNIIKSNPEYFVDLINFKQKLNLHSNVNKENIVNLSNSLLQKLAEPDLRAFINSFRNEKIESKIMHEAEFIPSGHDVVRGKSDSKQVSTQDGSKYQLKRSGSTNLKRSMIGYNSDNSDILGEAIASKIASKTLNNEILELCPKVKFVYNGNTKELKIASKYLNCNNNRYISMDFDKIYEKCSNTSIQSGHVLVGGVGNKTLPLDTELLMGENKVKISKEDLCKMLALSMKLGDADVNPGNMFLIFDKETEKSHIGRIDFGHAFNDLIKNWGLKSGLDINDKEHRGLILDFINRAEINGGESKLFRDYVGIIPSEEMIKALRNESKGIKENMKEIKEELKTLFEIDPQLCKRSLVTLSKQLDRGVNNENISNEELIEIVGNNITNFFEENERDAKSVANIMEMQMLVDKALTTSGKDEEIMKKIQNIYKQDEKYFKEKTFSDKIEWIRTDKNENTRNCSLKDFIKYRAEQVAKKDNSLKNEIKDKAELLSAVLTVREKVSKNIADANLLTRNRADANLLTRNRADAIHKKELIQI